MVVRRSPAAGDTAEPAPHASCRQARRTRSLQAVASGSCHQRAEARLGAGGGLSSASVRRPPRPQPAPRRRAPVARGGCHRRTCAHASCRQDRHARSLQAAGSGSCRKRADARLGAGGGLSSASVRRAPATAGRAAWSVSTACRGCHRLTGAQCVVPSGPSHTVRDRRPCRMVVRRPAATVGCHRARFPPQARRRPARADPRALRGAAHRLRDGRHGASRPGDARPDARLRPGAGGGPSGAKTAAAEPPAGSVARYAIRTRGLRASSRASA